MEKNDKAYTEGISPSAGKAAKWFDNYWYHYKWTTVIVAFFLIVGIVCTVSMCTKKTDDITLVYAGRVSLSAAEADNICRAFEAECPPEIAKKGEASVGLGKYYILSETQIKDIEAETHEDGQPMRVDRGKNSDEYNTYYSYIQTGESAVLLLDRWLYDSLLANDRLAPLSESCGGATPERAFSEYGIELKDTEIYKQYPVMQMLPEDTVVCILRPYVFGKSSKEKYYKLEQEMLESIIYKRID